MEAHETIHETAHHGTENGHAAHPKSSRNKKIAILISVLAALLAITNGLGKSAQNTSLSANVHASDLWSFFQAKTIRMTQLRIGADTLEMLLAQDGNALKSETAATRIKDWRALADRYDSDPDGGEGRKELAARAKADEERRDQALKAYHLFEYSAAAMEIAIVLCSASVVTDTLVLTFMAGGLGIIGIGFGLVGLSAFALVH